MAKCRYCGWEIVWKTTRKVRWIAVDPTTGALHSRVCRGLSDLKRAARSPRGSVYSRAEAQWQY